jgi:hypothetical protein
VVTLLELLLESEDDEEKESSISELELNSDEIVLELETLELDVEDRDADLLFGSFRGSETSSTSPSSSLESENPAKLTTAWRFESVPSTFTSREPGSASSSDVRCSPFWPFGIGGKCPAAAGENRGDQPPSPSLAGNRQLEI